MRRAVAALALASLALTAFPHVGYTCGDKFLVPGRGTSLESLHRPPKTLEILIYGNPSSGAVAAVSKDDFRQTLMTVGHRVHTCDGPTSCAKAVATGRFDVVLADPSDAAKLKSGSTAGGPAVVPVMLKPSKEVLAATKAEYGEAFDPSRGSLRLLSVVSHATKGTR